MKKKLIITLLVLLLIGGAGTAAVLLYRNHARTGNPVKVYSLQEYLGNWYENEPVMNGVVRAGMDQNVYLETDQIIKEILVQEGDEVKTGDPLLRFDTEKLELHIATLKAEHEVTLANIAVSQDELKRLKRIKPVPDNYQPEPSQAEKDLQAAEETLNAAEAALTEFEDGEEAAKEEEARAALLETISTLTELTRPVREAKMTEAEFEKLLQEYQEAKEAVIEDMKEKKAAYDDAVLAKEEAYDLLNTAYEKAYADYVKADEAYQKEQEGRSEEETYTKSQLALLISAEERNLRDEGLNSRQEEIEIRKEEMSLQIGSVTATRDGKVTLVDPSAESIDAGRPVIRVSGDSSYEAVITVDEWKYGRIEIGTEMSLMNYEDGMTYMGVVTGKAVSPVSENNWGVTASNYEVTVAIRDAENLTEGSWLEARMGDEEGEEERMNTLVIPKYFVKQENGKYYAMKNEGGKLVKQYLSTGKVYYGEMIVVKSGLTASDSVAFPYEKAAVEGQATEPGELMDFWEGK